jgi:hypothetical protein
MLPERTKGIAPIAEATIQAKPTIKTPLVEYNGFQRLLRPVKSIIRTDETRPPAAVTPKAKKEALSP